MFKEQARYIPQISPAVEKKSLPFDILERFREAPFKIAMQKDGELADISRRILAEEFGIDIPDRNPKERRLLDVSENGFFGFMYTRNKDICKLVASGAVDLAIAGLDRIIEDGVEDKVAQINTYNRYSWPIVFATPYTSTLSCLEQTTRVATQYPEITRRFFASIGQDISIVKSAGGTEVFPYITIDGQTIDAIIDLSVTGTSLTANGLIKWDPPILTVSPVMIVNPKSMDKYIEQKQLFEERTNS